MIRSLTTRLLLWGVLLGAAGSGVAACSKFVDQSAPCETTSSAPAALAFVVGARANSAKPMWDDNFNHALQALLSSADNGGPGGVTIVRADGRPSIACVKTYTKTAKNQTALDADHQNFIDDVQAAVLAVTPQAAQANPLEALSLAAAAVAPGGAIVLIDSGLQTVAPLDFRVSGLLTRRPTSVVDALARLHGIPNVTGRRVIFAGIGYTSAPQSSLDAYQRGQLAELWRQIAIAGKAQSVTIVTTPNTTRATPELPSVATVPVPPPGVLEFRCDSDIVFPNTGPVSFMAEDTAFVHPDAARAALAKLASWLRANPQARATITGSIAHYGSKDDTGLSLERAERVRDVLVGLQVDKRRLQASGAGWGPFPTSTAPAEPLADDLNRRVVIGLSCD